jgi:hypothetical protein
MKVGTKSVLFGAHAFWIHPWFVALAWWKLYGFPLDPRLWVAFFVHDLGYVGKPNMDGKEPGGGEEHPYLGAFIMRVLFGEEWADFCLRHSRFMCKRLGRTHSRLCVADKLSIVLTPAWLYLPMVNWSGEVHEYMKLADARHAEGEPRFEGKYVGMNVFSEDQQQWFANVQTYLNRWVNEHKDLRVDTWTPSCGEGTP